MRWGEESKRPEYLQYYPCIHAKEIVYSAFMEGFINWNILNKVLEKINSNMNGNWMFDYPSEKI